jgi:uncharacterized protein (TIGR02172 family)
MATHINLEELKIIARGGQAEIFEYDNNKVLRVAKRPQDYDRIRSEYSLYSQLAASNIDVPRVYELVEINGAPAIIMDKINGISMMDQIKRNPFGAGERSKELAELHLKLINTSISMEMTNTKKKARYCIEKSEQIEPETKEKIFEILGVLPNGNSICHGDFHPGNILCQGKKRFIIDWSAASKGDYHADIAHTYILLRLVPKAPHVNSVVNYLQKMIGRSMSSAYLSTITGGSKIDLIILSKWILTNIAERTYHGMISERDDLRKLINKYFILQRHGKEDNFYKFI